MKKINLGDIVRFKKNDNWYKYHKGNYEVGFITNGGGIKLQHIRTKERLPVTYNKESIVLVKNK